MQEVFFFLKDDPYNMFRAEIFCLPEKGDELHLLAHDSAGNPLLDGVYIVKAIWRGLGSGLHPEGCTRYYTIPSNMLGWSVCLAKVKGQADQSKTFRAEIFRSATKTQQFLAAK